MYTVFSFLSPHGEYTQPTTSYSDPCLVVYLLSFYHSQCVCENMNSTASGYFKAAISNISQDSSLLPYKERNVKGCPTSLMTCGSSQPVLNISHNPETFTIQLNLPHSTGPSYSLCLPFQSLFLFYYFYF